MNTGTLTEVLSDKHLSIPDRIARGACPHPPLLFADVSHFTNIVASRRRFPKPFRAAAPGHLVAELTDVERRGPHECVVYEQRSGPSGYTVTGVALQRFDSPTDAAAFFLCTEHRLPGDIDGWKVVE